MSTKFTYDTGSPNLDTILGSINDTMTIGGTAVSEEFLNSTMNVNSSLTWPPYGQYNITTQPHTGPTYTFSNGTTTQNNTIQVNGEGADVLLNGKSLKTFMEAVEDRLAILQPDPAKLEKYAALRKAYEHYKLMEKLVKED